MSSEFCPHCGMALSADPAPIEPVTSPTEKAETLGPEIPPFEFVPTENLASTSTHSEDRSSLGIAVLPPVLETAPIVERTSSAAEPHRSGGPFRWLLPSYASALTLALLWMLATGRIALRQPPRSATPPVTTVPTEEAPLAEIPAAYRVPLGGSLRLGDLEIRPTELRLRHVDLRSGTDEEESWRDGGTDALWLRLRLRNNDADGEITPIDAEFVRRPDRGPADSLIESGTDPIQLYPLAASSEWSIEGQDFPRLAPGEEADVWLVSEPDVRDRLSAKMLWRLRLRVAPNRTEVIGVEISRGDIEGG